MASSSQQPLLFPPVDPFSAKIPSASLPHPKTQKLDLFRVWTELCMRESQARIRNQQLLQDFAELEAQLALLAAKTDALRRRKRDYEEFLQRLKGDLPMPEHQGSSRRQGLVSDKPSELLARPFSIEWNGQLPLETEYQSVPLQFPPFDIAPAHVSGARERLGPKFWEYKQSKAPLAHPFYPPAVHPDRKHGGPTLPSPWSPLRLQKDEKAWLFSGQERSHFPSSPLWTVPARATVSGRGHLPEKLLGPVMAQVTGGQTTGSPTGSNTLQGKEARGDPILTRGGSAEEHRDMALKREGHHLPCDPAELSYHLRLHGEASSCMDENQLGLPLLGSDNDSSGASISSLVEVNSGQWVAKRNSKGLPRQQRMKAKQEDADTTMISNDGCVHMSWERFPGLLEHEETAIIQGSRKLLREETLPHWEKQGNEEIGEKGESEKETSVDEGGEAMRSLGSGLELTAEECRPLREAGAQEDEEIKEGAGGLEQEQEDQGGNKLGEVGTAGKSNDLGCFDQGQEDLEKDNQANLGPGSQERESLEGERKQQWSHGEEEKSDQEAEGLSGEKTSKPCRSEESQHDVSGDKEGDLEWADGSREGPIHLQKEEEAASTGSSSDEVVIGSQICIMSKQDNSEDCQNPSLQNEGPVVIGADSIGEEEEEEEEEEEIDGNEVEEEEKSEADIDIEVALAPYSNKPEATRARD